MTAGSGQMKCSRPVPQVRTRVFCVHLLYNNDHSTKTGSGQTWGKHSNTRPVFLLTGKLTVVDASLSRPFFGLTTAAFDELAGQVGAVLHLAAKVDLQGSFDAHRAANIDGVRDLASFD
jgi:nucleoside-diphosphate-sugar epimerase